MKTVTISLPEPLAAHLEGNFAFHGYEDVSGYVADVLQNQQKREQETLKELLLEGLNSGEAIPVTSEFWAELRADTDAILVEHGQSLNKASAA